MTQAPRSPQQPVGWRATCALLVPGAGAGAAANVDPSPRLYELEEALLRRGVDIVRCRGVHDAMAEALIHERRRRAGEVRDPFIVVFVEPERMPEAPALVDAAANHAPSTVFWQYTKEPSPRLTAWVPAEVLSAQTEPKPRIPRPVIVTAATPPIAQQHTAQPAPASPPTMLRLAGDIDDDEEDAPDAPPSLADTAEVRVHAPTASELTEEELAMLLAPEEESPPRPRR